MSSAFRTGFWSLRCVEYLPRAREVRTWAGGARGERTSEPPTAESPKWRLVRRRSEVASSQGRRLVRTALGCDATSLGAPPRKRCVALARERAARTHHGARAPTRSCACVTRAHSLVFHSLTHWCTTRRAAQHSARGNTTRVRSCAGSCKEWLLRPSHSVTLSPASPASYRYDGDLASDTRFLSQEGGGRHDRPCGHSCGSLDVHLPAAHRDCGLGGGVQTALSIVPCVWYRGYGCSVFSSSLPALPLGSFLSHLSLVVFDSR